MKQLSDAAVALEIFTCQCLAETTDHQLADVLAGYSMGLFAARFGRYADSVESEREMERILNRYTKSPLELPNVCGKFTAQTLEKYPVFKSKLTREYCEFLAVSSKFGKGAQ